MKKPLHITIPITKVDEEQRMVYGYATVEELDSHGEIITYEASKKAFSNWIGNIREMHQDIAVGKAIDIEFDDDAKGVWIGAKISESTDGENAWTKVKEGVLAGFSIGGRVNDCKMTQMMIDGKKKMVNVIDDYDLGETSLVDNPAVASATFQIIKSKGGKLFHEESFEKQLGRHVAWWEKQFHYSDSQNIMKGSVMVYNEDSMGKQDTLAKSLWQGAMLADLAMCLSDYIFWQSYDGEKDLSALKSALEAIQAAAAEEILEPENFPDYEESIANAAKALNIKKSEELITMSKQVRDRAKSVTGAEDRDADAAVVTTAEDNGRPVNDTADRAAEAGVPVAGTEVEQEVVGDDGKPTGEKETVVQPLVNAEGEELVEVDEEGNEVVADADDSEEEDPADDPEDAEEEEPETPAADDKSGKDGKGKQKKFAPKATIQKSTEQSDLAKMVASAVADGIAKAVEPLKEEIASLRKQPAASKVRKTYTVKKGEDVENPNDPDPNSEEGKNQKHMDGLLKRADELAADPAVGTHDERLKVAFELRKYSRLLDPESRAKHASVRASFRQ
ncbi:MAG: HK97 family phage prohead protease [Candidatus Babeliales bacterium]|jgi:HK97 family phage prohead protease